MYFSEIKESKDHLIVLSDLIEDNYYNYCAGLCINNINEFIINWNQIKNSFPKDREPALYISPLSNIYCKQNVFLKNFKNVYTDAWMVLENENYLETFNIPDNIIIKKVSTFNEFKEFIDVFKKAYSSDDPSDPYGNLSPTYTDALKRSFDKNDLYKKNHYIGFINGIPAGVATAITKDDLVGIYNVATISEYRKKSIGKSLMSYIVKDLYQQNTTIFLQTEKDTFVETWYKKQGFQTMFLGECYIER